MMLISQFVTLGDRNHALAAGGSGCEVMRVTSSP